VRRGNWVVILLALTATACGGSGKPNAIYAGMTKSAARELALTQSGSQTTDASDELYGHHLRLLGITRGHDLDGTPSWQATFRDRSDYRRPRLCIWFANGQYSGGISLVLCPKRR
jgi:hypothetical protein